jgi:hypothetical protein
MARSFELPEDSVEKEGEDMGMETMSRSTSGKQRAIVSIIPRRAFDIYTTLLAIAMGAMLLACVLMVLELASYNFAYKPPRSATGAR